MKTDATTKGARPHSLLILAGARPGPDPLLDGTGLSTKALLPIAGQPMLAHVLRAAQACPDVRSIVVAAQHWQDLSADPQIARAAQGVEWVTSRQTIAETVLEAVHRADGPLLITTADNVLLRPEMISEFLAKAAGSDLAVGVVSRSTVAQAGLSTQRTWLPFRGDRWTGCNLFRLSGPATVPLIERWATGEQARKKSLAVLGMFGTVNLLAAILRLRTIHGFAKHAARGYGLVARAVSMSAAEICIDADKPSDIAVIEHIMRGRGE